MSASTGEPMEYAANGRRHIGLLLAADGDPRAAVVLLPDWRGQSDLALDHAAFVRGLGCCVVVADLYGDGFNPDSPDQVGPLVQRLVEHRDEGAAALAACVAALRERVPAGTPVVVLGYSAGGMIALDYGRSGGDVAGIVLCSALLKTAADGMGTKIAAPVLVLQGTRDQVSPMETIAAVIAEMDDAGNDVRLELFSQTHHAFDNPDAGTDPTARLVYSEVSAARARRAIAAFVDEVSGRSPQQSGPVVVPVLRTFSGPEARRFYLDFLGFTLDWEHRFEDGLPLYQQVSGEGCVLHLSEHHGDATPGSTVRIEVADVRRLQRRLADSPVYPLRPGVSEEAWGDDLVVPDPFGNRLVFHTPRRATP